MAKPCAVVDVIGAETGTNQLLEQIRLFVAALGTAETSQCVLAVGIANPHQRVAGQIERLFPRGFTKNFAPVFGIEFEIRGFSDTGLANQGLGQALLMMCVVKS